MRPLTTPSSIRPRNIVTATIVTMALSFAACGGESEEVTIEGRKSNLYVKTSQLWSSLPVPICWENDNPSIRPKMLARLGQGQDRRNVDFLFAVQLFGLGPLRSDLDRPQSPN